MQIPETHTSAEIATAIVDRAFARVFPQDVPILDEHGDVVQCDLCDSDATVKDFDSHGYSLPKCTAHATEDPRHDVVSFALVVLP